MKRGRVALGWTAAAAVGIAVGALAAWTIVNTGRRGDYIGGPGPWYTTAKIGDASASPIIRAGVALRGIWALPRAEVIYFNSDTDDAGRKLDPNCVYAIRSTGDPATRWWSLSLYRDNFWVDNPDDRYSFSKTTVARDARGGWTVLLAGRPQAANWLPMGTRPGKFALSMRLYQPEPSVAADPKNILLPKIGRLSCT